MPVSYPASMPTSGISNVSWTNTTASMVSRSPFTFQGQAQYYSGAIRYANITVSDLNRDDAEDWIGFLDSLHGTRGTFLFGDPHAASGPMGVGSGNPTVSSGTVGQDQLGVSGLPANVTRWLRRGDWFQLGSGLNSRLYKTTAQANSSSGGTTTLNIWPALRATPAGGAALILNNPRGLFRRSTGEFAYTESNDCRFALSFNCEEVV